MAETDVAIPLKRLEVVATPVSMSGIGTVYQWRHVSLNALGVASGYRDGSVSRCVVPMILSGRQQTTAQIQLEAEDGNWTNGIISIRKGSDPNGVFADLGTPQTLVNTETQESVTSVNFPYLALQVTTIESGGSAAYLTITITTSEGA